MGALSKLSSSSGSLQRAKVYRLNGDGKWVDQGTGHASVDCVEMSKDLHLVVIDEEDRDAILVHHISSEDIYRRQEGTIISWRDVELSTDLALSFQETAGCSHIWDKICEVQRTLQFNNIGGHDVARSSKGTTKAPETMQSKATAKPFHAINDELRELPPVELSTLSLILKNVVECGTADQVRVADLIIQDQSFFPKLLELFKMCEDLQDMESLHMIFRLVRGIISLNNPQIFDKIFGEQYILDIIGSLEYDPDVPSKHQFRAFLKNHVVFKEAVPIKNPAVLSKIHQTYKVGFIKDFILPKIMDDATAIISLSSIIHANNGVVIQLLKDDTSFIQELFARMRSSSISLESKIDLGFFLHEFCSLSKGLQPVDKNTFFRSLASEGIFDIITNMLQSEDKMLVYHGTEILILYLYQDPGLLRSYVVQQEQNLLFKLLVKGMLTDCGEEIYCQFLEVIQMLIDPTTISGPQGGNIIDMFYNHHLDELIDVIASSCPPRNCLQSNKTTSGSSTTDSHLATKPDILYDICKLLCFCVLHHPNRINCSFLSRNVIEKVLFLTRRREKYLVVAAIRFMRTILSHMDEHLIYHIMQNNLLNSIIEVFIENGDRYNMLHSGVLDLLEFICKKGSTILISYIVESFWDRLKIFARLDSIQTFKLKYEQSLEMCKTMKIVDEAVPRTDPRSLEKEKEDHMKEDSPKSGGLVNYDDDDEAHNSASRKTEESSNEHNHSSSKNKRRLPDTEREEELESRTKKQKLEKQTNNDTEVNPSESAIEDDSSKSHSNTTEAKK